MQYETLGWKKNLLERTRLGEMTFPKYVLIRLKRALMNALHVNVNNVSMLS